MPAFTEHNLMISKTDLNIVGDIFDFFHTTSIDVFYDLQWIMHELRLMDHGFR